MLIQLREGLRNSKILKFVFVGIISVPFVFVGFGSYFSGGADLEAATVNGDGIPTALFERANLDQQQRMRQMFGGRVPAELLNTRGMREDVLEALVNEQLMVQRSQSDYYTVSDLELAKAVQSDPSFQINGQFDRERYQQILSANRSSPQIFEETLRRQLVLQQLYQSVSTSDFNLGGEQARFDALQRQEREISRASINLALVREGITVSEDDMLAFYDANPDQFMRAEQFKVSYIDVDAGNLADSIELIDSEIEDSYQRRIGEFGRAEQRDASHILINLESDTSESARTEARDRAQALLERLDAGEAFDELAASESEDLGSSEMGGNLGSFERGVMPAAFDEALFALEEGTYSDVVQTEFGFHIIRLNEVLPTTAAPLEEVRPQVEQDLRAQLVTERFIDQRETLSDESFDNPNSLDSAAEQLGVEVLESDWISADLTDGLGGFPAVIAALQTEDVRDEGLNSELIDLSAERVVVVRLEDYREPELEPFETVREQVETLLRDREAREKADQIAADLVQAVRDGTALETAAATTDSEFEAAIWAGRQSAEVDAGVLREVFEAAHPSSDTPVVIRSERGNGDPVIVAIHAVREGAETDSGDDVAEGGADSVQARAMSFGAAAFQAIQQAMRAEADVTLNERVLDPDFVPYGAQGQHGGM